MYSAEQVQAIVSRYLSKQIRHTLKGLSYELSCSGSTLYNYRTGYYNGHSYGKENSHNRIISRDDFPTIRAAADTIKAEGTYCSKMGKASR